MKTGDETIPSHMLAADPPPWDAAMSSGCDLPYWLRSQLGILDRQFRACDPACIEHDRAYYEGGTEEDRARADATLRDHVAPIVSAFWADLWHKAIQRTGAPHFGTGRTWDGRTLGPR